MHLSMFLHPQVRLYHIEQSSKDTKFPHVHMEASLVFLNCLLDIVKLLVYCSSLKNLLGKH